MNKCFIIPFHFSAFLELSGITFFLQKSVALLSCLVDFKLAFFIIRLILAIVEVSDQDRYVSGSSYLRSDKSRNFAFKRLAYI